MTPVDAVAWRLRCCLRTRLNELKLTSCRLRLRPREVTAGSIRQLIEDREGQKGAGYHQPRQLGLALANGLIEPQVVIVYESGTHLPRAPDRQASVSVFAVAKPVTPWQASTVRTA